ncbi:protein PF3D7_1417600-like isoform X2 [Diabrotica virgifera virgifera]|uniref:Protein PF14_0175-like n=1 Tax=Diabrotica virgifera virgifera TaxID=50390 RepID=A0ABM5L8P0_DIAVI|nr:protein PF3D7_1417600-like isoform X2 [Diabrotica virgifera virgifera]
MVQQVEGNLKKEYSNNQFASKNISFSKTIHLLIRRSSYGKNYTNYEANRTNSVLPPKTKISASNQGRKCSKTSNKTVKPPKPKKFAKVTQNPNPLVLFSRLPTIPTVTQQILLLQNAPVVNNTRSSVVRLSTGPKARKSKKSPKKHTVPSTNSSLSTLGAGTLILANGNIISLVSQPQVIVPPLPLTPTNATIHSSPNVNRIIRKNQPMKAKSCVTNTTQVNKIPIPALTSKYANTSILKKSPEKINKNMTPKVEPAKKTGVKRKLNEKHDKALKKSKSCDNCEKQKDNTNKNDNKIIDKSETEGEKLTDTSETIVATTNTNDTVSNTNNNLSSGLVPTLPNDHLIQEVSADDQTLKLMEDKSDKSLNKSNDIQKEVTPGDVLHKENTDKEIPASDTLTPSCVILASSEPSLVSCTTAPITVSCKTTTSNTRHEENMKNIDLMHSDLSNDIFASLQVPPGCQNIESTSPTAAFLMAFPIVSSIKVTEVIDEDNSDSQRETPTLLQIGMDNNSKPSNNEALLSLENFSFFNSKDIYYNTKLDNGTSEENVAKDNNQSQRMSNEESKTKRTEELGNNFEVFSKPDQLDNNPTITQQVNMFNQQDSCNMMNLNAFQAPTNELPAVLDQKNSMERKGNNAEQYNNLIQEHLLANSMNVSYNISAGNLCKENIEEINFKDCKTPRGNTVHNITPQEHPSAAETINNTFNPQNAVTFSSNSSKMPEPTSQSLEKLSDGTKMTETFQYNNKHLEQTKNFSVTLKTVERSNQSLEKVETVQKVGQYRYPVLQNESLNLDNYEQLKNAEKLNTNKTRDNFSYNPKHFLQNEHHINNFPSKVLDNSGHNVQKPDQKEFLQVNNFSSKLLENAGQKSEVNKERNNYQYHPKQFEHFPSKILENSGQNLQKQDQKEFLQVNNFSSKILENSGQKSEVNKERDTYQYNPKQFLQNDHQINNFPPKLLDNSAQHLQKPDQKEFLQVNNYSSKLIESSGQKSELNKERDTYQYNPKQFLQNEHQINNFPSKLVENSGQNLQKPDQKEFLQSNNFSSKLLENPGQKSEVNKERDNYQYNQKQFLQNDHQINNFPSKLVENSGQSLQKSDQKEFLQANNFSSKLLENPGQKSELNKERDTYQYNPKQFLQNEHQINNFPSKLVENSGQSLQKPDQKEFLKVNNFSSKLLENPGQKSEVNKERDNYQYNQKQFLQNDHQINNFPSKLVESSGQSLQKPDQKEFLQVNNFSSKLLENPSQKSEVNKERDNYQYNSKQFLQNDHNLNIFSTNPVKLPERTDQTVEKSEKNKTYQYNQKHYVQTDNTGATFASTPSKMLENVTQSVEKSAKTYHYTNNPFEIAPTTKELSLNVGDRQKSTDTKGIDACAKPIDEKACYFTSNYTSTSYRPNTSVVRSDSSKVCHTGSYENSNKNYTNPFYTNCNYNYADTSFNQNYYKTEKSCYSLNYENYQEYRKSDTTFNRDRRSSTTKEKQVLQNKPVNWMTTTEQKSSDCFLPSFTNQSYSFSSCINSESDVNPSKSTDFSDKRFTWSPSKLPNFLEPSHNFITPTLPTLVGDLALGNALPLAEPKTDAYKCPKEAKRKTYDNQANFLSVSQLVNQSKTDPVPAKTMSRRLSGSKSTKPATNKLKRCEKTVDKSTKPVNTYSDVFYDQKNRTSTKNISSNYSAEALIGNQCPQEEKKYPPQNIGTYFPSVDDNYVNQNQNFHSYTHNSFQNNSYSTNSFIYTTPISTNYLNNTFDNTLDYSAESIMNYNKNCNNKNSRVSNKEEKTNYGSNSKKQKKTSQGNGSSLANFEYPLLPIQGSTNSPLLPDDFQSHTTFLPPTTPYPCKNTLYQKQGNDFNAAPLLPIPGITRAGIQHPEVSPSLNHVGTSLTNFNLSTIFPEINKGTIPNVHNSSNKTKHSSSYLQVPFNSESKYGFQS